MDRSDILFMFRCIFYMQAINIIMAVIIMGQIRQTRKRIEYAVKIMMMNQQYGKAAMNIAGITKDF